MSKVQFLDAIDLICQYEEKNPITPATPEQQKEEKEKWIHEYLSEIDTNLRNVYSVFKDEGFSPLQSTIKTRAALIEYGLARAEGRDSDIDQLFLSPEERLKHYQEEVKNV